MNARVIFDIYKNNERDIVRDVYIAESKYKPLHEKLKQLDNELAFEIDNAVGRIARAYELQGFTGGLKILDTNR